MESTRSPLCPWVCVPSLPVFLPLLSCGSPGPCPTLSLGTDQELRKHGTTQLPLLKPCIEVFQTVSTVSLCLSLSLPSFLFSFLEKIDYWKSHCVMSKKIIVDLFSLFLLRPLARRLDGPVESAQGLERNGLSFEAQPCCLQL